MTTESNLAERLDRLESIEAIRQLKYAYCRACDFDYDGPSIADLFTEDGVWDGLEFGRQVGRRAIAAYFDGVERDIPFAAHVVTNGEIAVDQDSASGHWWLMMPCVKVLEGEERAHWDVAEYDEKYRRVEGEWKIAELVCKTRYFLPVVEDWSASWRASMGREDDAQ